MAEVILNTIFQIRRGSKTALSNKNLLLRYGEPCYEYPEKAGESGKLKIGDGVTRYNDLKYITENIVLPEEAAKFTGVQETLPDPASVEENTFCIVKGILYIQTKGKWIPASASQEVIKDSSSSEEQNSCTIDGKSYATIEEAIAAASPTDTITVTKDLSTIEVNKQISLDLNSAYILNNDKTPITIDTNGIVTLKGEGTVECNKHATPVLSNNGIIIIENGSYLKSIDEKNNGFYVVVNHGDLNIKGGVFSSPGDLSSMIENGYVDYNAQYVEGTNKQYPSLTIDGGTFISKFYIIKNDDNSKAILNNGNFFGTILHNGFELTINDGVFSIDDGSYNLRVRKLNDNMNKATTYINGGTFDSNGDSNFKIDDETAEIIVKGGKFNHQVPEKYLLDGYVQKYKDGYYIISKEGE